MCRGSYSSACIHPALDKETGKAGEKARQSGGVGRGDIRCVGCDAMELPQKRWAVGGAL